MRWRAAVAGSLAIACGVPPVSGSKPAGQPRGISPPPRVLEVHDDRLLLEGRWYPIEPGPKSPPLPNAVRVVCVRAKRSCKEDLTRFSSAGSAESVHDVLQYRVSEWTRGNRAGKLVASRQEGAVDVEIRVALRGGAAEKVVIKDGVETRWRLE